MAEGRKGFWVVLKFGASVSHISDFSRIANIVRQRRAQGARLVIVGEDLGPAFVKRLAAEGVEARWATRPASIEARGAIVVLSGSDADAAALAARLSAARLEVCGEAPGLFSADPGRVPAARLLRALHYDEAQEIAGAEQGVLHPQLIPPMRQSGIPIHLVALGRPEIESTVISAASSSAGVKVKAVCFRNGVTLVSMDSAGMWHEVGFLADAFAVFRKRGLSVDLVSTSETNVTVSLDPGEQALDGERLAAAVGDLARFCRVQVLGPCAAVSLVGRNIRAILHQLGAAFELFEEQKVYLVSQAANDLNFTFVVDERQGERLAVQLHELLIRPDPADRVFGPTREQLFTTSAAPTRAPEVWWQRKREFLLEALGAREAAYVYDRASVVQTAQALRGLRSIAHVLYAMKANPHPELLALAHREGLGIECVSQAEIERVLEVLPAIERRRILFTPNFAPRAEYEWAYGQDVRVTVDNLYALEAWAPVFREREAFVRIDPGAGRGHHQHVRTAGAHSKFGVPIAQLDALAAFARASRLSIVGLHAHLGSGNFDPATWAETAKTLATLAARFPEVRVIDVGGGLGVAERGAQHGLDLAALDGALADVASQHRGLELWLEPGRYLIANAGVLLARVTQTKSKGEVRYVGVGTGMNSLIRPALYGAYHEIVNLTRLDEAATELVNVVGPICESGDVLGHDRLLPPTREGDVLLIATAGAYGRAMSSSYNLRPPAEELWI